MYGTSATDVVGFTFEADLICPPCLRAIAARYAESNGKAADFVALPELLKFWADREGWDADDESSYDSSDFPKVVFGSMVESSEEKCGWCDESLIP